MSLTRNGRPNHGSGPYSISSFMQQLLKPVHNQCTHTSPTHYIDYLQKPTVEAAMNMDFSALKEQVTNLSLYDLKAGVRRVQNGKLSSLKPARRKKGAHYGCISCHELHGDGGEGKYSALSKIDRVANLQHQVREATNNEPWGASTTLMQEIATGTYS